MLVHLPYLCDESRVYLANHDGQIRDIGIFSLKRGNVLFNVRLHDRNGLIDVYV